MTREEAISAAREVAAYLKQTHGATRVLLFGSCASGDFRPGHSDIDIYFEGIAPKDDCLVTGKTVMAFVDLDLDLWPETKALPYLKEEIRKTGIVL